MSWKRGSPKPGAVPPPPPTFSKPVLEPDGEKRASNNGHGTDDALKVTNILEKNNMPCCCVNVSALIFYGAARVRPDWEICVQTEHVDKAAELLQSEPHSRDYCLVEPWGYPSQSLLHTYSRFKGRGIDFHFTIIPATDVHIICEPFNFIRSLRGLPYPKLDVFIQSSLDTRNELQLCDVVDGTDVSEQWGEDNLELDGTNDLEWAEDINRRGREFANGKFAHWAPFAPDAPRSRRDMWRSKVRTKRDRLDWTKPSDIFVTQYRLVDDPDPWTVLSERY